MRAAESDLDPFGEAWIRDPHPHQAALREAGPVVRLARYGVYATGRHDLVEQALGDWETFISSAGVGIDDLRRADSWRPRGNVLEADPPEHDLTRGILNAVMSARSLRALREGFEAKAEEMAEALAARRAFDAAADLGEAFPLSIFPDAMGITRAGRENLLVYSDMIFDAFGPRNAIFDAATANAAPVVDWLLAQCGRAALAPRGWGAEIYERAEAAGLSEEAAGVIVRALLTAGLDTTVNAIAAGVLGFALHPGEWDKVRDNPARAKTMIDEIIRWETPITFFFRTTTREVELGGVTVPKDAKIMLHYAAANRDPRRWEDPDRLDLDRRAIGHVAFGGGVHRCAGQLLARMEVELIFAALARRIARFELAGAPEVKLNNTLRGFASVPVRALPA